METFGPDDTQASVTPPTTPSPKRSSGDWPSQAADTIVTVVETVRDRTTGPLIVAARAVVFGVFIGTIGSVAAVLAIIGTIRLLDRILPSSVWLPYLILGIVFVAAGAVVFRRRNQSLPPARNSSKR
jgi:hypothetical protein